MPQRTVCSEKKYVAAAHRRGQTREREGSGKKWRPRTDLAEEVVRGRVGSDKKQLRDKAAESWIHEDAAQRKGGSEKRLAQSFNQSFIAQQLVRGIVQIVQGKDG